MSNNSPIKIAVLPGDGVGIDVIDAACPIFEALSLPVKLTFGEIGWACWQREGNPVPTKTWKLIEDSAVTLLGAITSMPKREAEQALPKHLQAKNIEYISPIIQLRQHLDLYANLRPCFNVKGTASPFNFSVVRENTEGLYSGFDYHPIPNIMHELLKKNPKWREKDPSKVSVSLRLQSEFGLRRLFLYAFQHAVDCNFTRVTFADKPNVLRQSAAFAREIFESVAENYPDITADILNVDAVALWMVKRPEAFGVIVAENMFGDILSDLGAGVMGGLGFAPSANIGEKGAYFEPVHGSAPNVERGKANPSAMFLTIAMLLEYLDFPKEAKQIRQGVASVLKNNQILTYDLGGTASTQEMAKAIIEASLVRKTSKTISFLATGAELLNGELQDKNAHHFSKNVCKLGGKVHAKAISSDNKINITEQLLGLLDKSDAVVITGGLGPTSDDNTRYALENVTKSKLVLDESSWKHVQERLSKFGLICHEVNRKQAMFPKEAIIFKNADGTANGCSVIWEGRDIFMLPGPPNECWPMFDAYVLPALQKKQYFDLCNVAQSFLTIGLIEGDISTAVDALAEDFSIETAYRWQYPYLEIKISTDQDALDPVFSKKLMALLSGHLISEKGELPNQQLQRQAVKLQKKVYVIPPVSHGDLFSNVSSEKIKITAQENLPKTAGVTFSISLVENVFHNDIRQVAEVEVKGEVANKMSFQKKIQTPNRGSELQDFVSAYVTWQLSCFIQQLL